MRIGINTRLLLSGKMDGIGWFSTETLRRIVRNHPEHDFYFFFDRKPDPYFIFASNVHPVTLFPQARHPLLWILFFEGSITWALWHYKIDLFLSPEAYMSLSTDVPTLTVFHDINYEHSRGNLKPSHQRYMDFFSKRFAHKSQRIATVSEFSKKDLVDVYHLNPNRIDIVYNGAHEGYRPITLEVQQDTRNKFSDGNPYFIFISTILRRKNLDRLLLAFDIFKTTDTQNTKLIVVGQRAWWGEELKKVFDNMEYQSDVIFLGRVDSQILPLLLGSAIGLVYPSLFEGFGIPILEALQAEVPVITSNCTSMPEVAGDAALLVNPNNAHELSESMTKIANDESLRLQLIAKGRSQRMKFSWDLTAQKLWNSMMKTIEIS